jgi:hypothetical protein
MGHVVDASEQNVLDWLLKPIDWTQSYRNLLYLLLTFPLGLCYFIFFTVGLSVGAGLSAIFIGVPILLGVLRAARSLGSLERRLARSLLDVNIPPPTGGAHSCINPSGSGLLSEIKMLLSDSITWKSLAFLVLKFPLGIMSFVLLFTSFSVSVSLTLAPVLSYVVPVDVNFWLPWATPTVAGEAVCCVVGVVLLIASVHLMNGLALGWGRFTRIGLGNDLVATKQG